MGSRGYDDGGADLTGGDSRNIRYNHVSRDDGEISARWSVARSPLAHSGPRGGSSFTQPERFIGNARRHLMSLMCIAELGGAELVCVVCRQPARLLSINRIWPCWRPTLHPTT